MDDEWIGEEERIFSGYPRASIDHQSIVLPDKPSEHVLVFGWQLSVGDVHGGLEDLVPRDVAN